MAQTAINAFAVPIRDVVVPLLTALVGYFFSQMQAAGNIGRERYKALNGVLYTLLEMRWEMKTSNPSIAMEALRRVMVERFGDEAQRVLALPEVGQFFEQLFEHLLPSGRDSLAKRYSEAVQVIVPFYPTVAYQLASPDIIHLDSKIRTYLDKVRQHPAIVLDPAAPASMSILQHQLLAKAFDQALTKLTEDLQRIVALYPFFKQIKIARVVRSQDRGDSTDELYKFVNETFEKLMVAHPESRHRTTV